MSWRVSNEASPKGIVGLPRVRFTVRTMMVAMAAVAVSLAAWNQAMEAWDSYRFHKGWDTCDVQGEVTAVERQKGRVTISIGSDDGIVPGEILYLFRAETEASWIAETEARYIGKLSIISVEFESAVGQILANVQGPAIQAGDRVAHFTWDTHRRRFVCGYALGESIRPLK